MTKAIKKTDFNILSIYCSSIIVGSGVSGVNSILQKLIDAYPGVPVSRIYLVSTIPSLLALCVTLFLGMLVGRKFSFRSAMILGMFLCLVGGVMPFWLNSSFTLILASRAVFGVGLGLLAFRITIIMNSYDEIARAKHLGMNIVFQNVGGALMQFTVGALGDIGYKYSFLTYAISIIPLVLLIKYLKEPASSAKNSANIDKPAAKVSVPPMIFVISVLYMIVTAAYNMMLLNNSTLIAVKGFGAAAAAGALQACFTFGAATGGLLLDRIYAFSKKYVVSLFAAVFVTGMLLIIISSNPIIYAIGIFMCGFSAITSYPLVCMLIGMLIDNNSMATVMSILSTFSYFGIFFANYGISLIGKISGDTLYSPLWAAAIICAVFGIVFSIKDPRPKKRIAVNTNKTDMGEVAVKRL